MIIQFYNHYNHFQLSQNLAGNIIIQHSHNSDKRLGLTQNKAIDELEKSR